jgi:hypothetical protein
MANSSTLSTGILYHNVTEMIKWLCQAFGFEKQRFGLADESRNISTAESPVVCHFKSKHA